MHAHDAVHNPSHSEQVVNRQQNDGNENQANDGKAVGDSAPQGQTARKDSQRLPNSPSHEPDSNGPDARRRRTGIPVAWLAASYRKTATARTFNSPLGGSTVCCSGDVPIAALPRKQSRR